MRLLDIVRVPLSGKMGLTSTLEIQVNSTTKIQTPTTLGWGFFIACLRQLPRVLAGSFGVLRTSPSPPLGRFGARFSLYWPFLSAGGTLCFCPKSAKRSRHPPYKDQWVTSCRIDWFVLRIGRRVIRHPPTPGVATTRRPKSRNISAAFCRAVAC